MDTVCLVLIVVLIVMLLWYCYHVAVDNDSVGHTYDIFDDVFRENGTDITGAYYDGDYSLSLSEAQQKKYDTVFNFLGIRPGDVVLDIGCGWGYLLDEVKRRGGKGIGLTLSDKQAEDGKRRGLDVRKMNWKDIADGFGGMGKVDHIVSIGAFEHFVTPDEVYKTGAQDRVYDDFFRLCYSLLKDGGKMYLQTMVFTKKGDEIARRIAFDIGPDLASKEGSDGHIMALLMYFYPDSCLPRGFEQIERSARPYFRVAAHNSGRKDYIVTLNEWGKLYNNMSPIKKAGLFLKYAPRIMLNEKMRRTYEAFQHSAQTEVFKRELFEHERIFLVKNSNK